MAQIISNRNLDFRQFNLWEVIDRFDHFGVWDNSNPSLDSSELPGLVGTYSAPDLSGFWTGAAQVSNATSKFLFGGNYVLNASGNAVSGTVTGMVYTETVGSDFNFFALVGVSTGAVRFQESASTASASDDIAWLKTALAGNDRITGSNYADYAYGRGGNDIMTGKGGNDTLMGDNGNDTIHGGSGHDLLTGGAGNDLIKGDAGRDQIRGGMGTDKMYGGVDTVRDVFIFASIAESAKTSARDVIYNFIHGTDDISLTAIDAHTGAAGNQAFSFGGKTAGAHAVWYATSGGNATVYGDVNGDRVADFSISLIGVTSLTAGDFLL